MSASGNLRERLYRSMIESDRPWSDEEIARDVLRMVSDPVRAEGLVRAILAGDARFVREDGAWRVRRHREPRIVELAFALTDAPPAPAQPYPPLLQLRAHDPDRRIAEAIREVTIEGRGLGEALALLQDRILVTLAPAGVRRFCHVLEQVHAIPGLLDRILDLSAALRPLGKPLPPAFARGSSAGTEERFEAIEEALAQVLAARGEATWQEIESEIASVTEGTAVDFSRFHFGPARLREVPEGPGIYRLRGEAGELLYVGKSRDLRRRIAEHFRPLAPDHRRRAALLADLRDLEWEETPSELEALLLESEWIRAHRPPHNQKIDLHEAGEEAPHRDEDLLFVLGEGEREEVSVFLIRSGLPWARGRLPRSAGEAARGAASALAKAWLTGEKDATAGLASIEPPEALLVLRYLRLFGDRVDRIRRLDHPHEAELAAALLALACRSRPSGDAWWMRASAPPPAA